MASIDNVYSSKCRFGDDQLGGGRLNTTWQAAPGPRDIEDPSVTGINRLGAHVPLRAFSTVEEARTARIEEGHTEHNFFRLLTPDGTRWRFHLSPNPSAAPEVEEGVGFPGTKSWDSIAVPSSLECEGHGQPVYTLFHYPFKCDPPLISPGVNYVGSYQTEFYIPSSWRQGRRVFLAFEGVGAAFRVWINGRFVGYSQDSFLPAEFDITSLFPLSDACDARCTLSVRVYRFCDGSYLESQDMWWLSGIHRDVVVYSKPSHCYIWDYRVSSQLAEAEGARASRVVVEVELRSHAHWFAEDTRVTARLWGPHALEPGEARIVPRGDSEEAAARCTLSPSASSHAEAAGDGAAAAGAVLWRTCRVEVPVGNARAWTAETPWLYTVVIAAEVDGVCVDAEVSRVGVRSVRVEGGQLKVNGVAVELRGVNRHEHDDQRGKYADLPSMRADIRLMKQLNFNAVRTSHYPNRSLWYDLCSAYGLWVVDEANLETQGMMGIMENEMLAKDARWAGAYLERMSRMVLRDRSHPCIILWSLGNESACGPNIDAMAEWTRRVDPTRPVQYESCGGGKATDIICPMYPSPADIAALTSLKEQNKRSAVFWRRWPTGSATEARPVIPCEYSHAMNNSVGNLDEFWRVIRSHPLAQGGFIWDWVDQGLQKTSPEGVRFWAYGGDFGEAVHDRNFCINGIVFPDRTLHPSAVQVRRSLQYVSVDIAWQQADRAGRQSPTAAVAVRNGSDFAALDGMEVGWRLEKEGVLVDSSDRRAAGPLPLEGVRAGQTFTFTIDCDGGQESAEVGDAGGELVLTVTVRLDKAAAWADAGHVVAWEQSVVPLPPAPPQAVPAPAEGEDGVLEVEETAERIVVRGRKFRAEWSKEHAGLRGLWLEGEQVLGGGEGAEGVLRQNLYRAPTDNDYGGWDRFLRGGVVDQVYPAEAGGMPRSDAGFVGLLQWTMWWGDVSYGREWELAGLDRLEACACQTDAHREEEQVVVRCAYTLRAAGTRSAIPCSATYRVAPSGEMVVESRCSLSPALPPPARIGVQLPVPRHLDCVEWFGRGLEECYVDRVGRYRAAVDELAVPYITPQENGNRCDVRWVALFSAGGKGLCFSRAGDPHTLLSFSALRSRASDLRASKHPHEVRRRSFSTLTLDHLHMPVGGDTSWSRSQHQEFLIPRGTHRFAFRISPLHSSPAHPADQVSVPASALPARPPLHLPPHPLPRLWHAAWRRARLSVAQAPIAAMEAWYDLRDAAEHVRCPASALVALAAVAAACLWRRRLRCSSQ